MIRRFEELPKELRLSEAKPYFEYLDSKRISLFFKRLFDIIIAFIVLVILSPIMLVSGVLVGVTSKGPVFYLQKRIGRYGKPFSIIKFRTMVQNADQLGAQVTVGENDPRITKVGNALRTTRIDEFPQMINILKGDMSLVGTRPEVPRYVEKYTPEMMATLLLRPGASGEASLKYRYENDMLKDKEDPEAYYVDTILPDKMAVNLEYTGNFSLGRDVNILLRTVACVFKK